MVISIIFTIAGIIIMIATLIYVKNKNNLQNIKHIDTTNVKKTKKTLCNLWGIDAINNQVISTNKKQHSIIIEIESIEYNLLHDDEKNSVDRELISIAQMIKFPIQFLEIKKKVDMEETIEDIRINTMNSNEHVQENARHLIKHLEKIQENKNLFERKNYMIKGILPTIKASFKQYKSWYKNIDRYGNNGTNL